MRDGPADSIALPMPSSLSVSIELVRERPVRVVFLPVSGFRRRGTRASVSLASRGFSVASDDAVRDFAARACFRSPLTAWLKADWTGPCFGGEVVLGSGFCLRGEGERDSGIVVVRFVGAWSLSFAKLSSGIGLWLVLFLWGDRDVFVTASMACSVGGGWVFPSWGRCWDWRSCSGRDPGCFSGPLLLLRDKGFRTRYGSRGFFCAAWMEIQNHSADTVGTPHSFVCRSFSAFTDCGSLHIKTDALGVRYSLYEAPRELDAKSE